MNTENKTPKSFARTKYQAKRAKLQRVIENTPEHTRNLVYLVKNNAEIRRFTALSIINMMKQKNMIDKDAKCYVSFLFNKYSINVNGLRQEYSYNNDIFIKSLAAAFPAFAYNAEKVINTYLNIENQKLDSEEVAEMVEAIKNNDSSPVEEETTESAE